MNVVWDRVARFKKGQSWPLAVKNRSKGRPLLFQKFINSKIELSRVNIPGFAKTNPKSALKYIFLNF